MQCKKYAQIYRGDCVFVVSRGNDRMTPGGIWLGRAAWPDGSRGVIARECSHAVRFGAPTHLKPRDAPDRLLEIEQEHDIWICYTNKDSYLISIDGEPSEYLTIADRCVSEKNRFMWWRVMCDVLTR